MRTPERLRLVPIAVAAAAALVVAAWAGLARLGLAVGDAPVSIHGPLMVLGFLGTVISLERAVGLARTWAWAAPVLAAAASLFFLAGWPRPGALVATFAGVALILVYGAAISLAGWEPHLAVMAVGALAWVVASSALAGGAAVPSVVPCLAAFLVLTICGERLELSRMGRPRSPWWRRLIVAAAAAAAVGAALALVDLGRGSRLTGLAFVALAIASAAGDIARRTIRTSGVTRYMAAALLAGYVWLVTVGVIWLAGGLAPGSPSYDAALHTLFVGFVLSMVFGHAPVIVPAVAQIDLPYRRSWWLALALLHGSLAVRVLGAIGPTPALRAWGGTLNVVALAVFAVLAAGSARRAGSLDGAVPA